MPNKTYTVLIKYQNGLSRVPVNVNIPFVVPAKLPNPNPNKSVSVMLSTSYSALMKRVFKGEDMKYIKTGGVYTFNTIYDLSKYEFILNDVLSCGRKKGAYIITFS